MSVVNPHGITSCKDHLGLEASSVQIPSTAKRTCTRKVSIPVKVARSFGETHTLRTGPALVPLAYIFAFQLDVVAKQLIGKASGDSYVAAQAPAPDVQKAAERMAREELGHVATMRPERRQAFHLARAAAPPGDAPDIIRLEEHFLKLIKSLPVWQNDKTLQGFAEETQERITTIPGMAFRRKPRLSGQLDLALGKPGTLCGILLDYCLNLMSCEKRGGPRFCGQCRITTRALPCPFDGPQLVSRRE
jgi:hypothetical protein